ncbi:hypothetical protein BC835DRAFT_1290334 [Cytidiella melzeri]|nr:hypothetical protein BC835DRAFT_1290334 [Cytidiella melzeri]
MLIVHPSSTCDVCLDPYTWATAANTPHAIACGHVFCLQCLMSTHPSLCPLCRKAFAPERIKKLHIDRYTADGSAEPDETIQVNGFLQRIALVSGVNTPEEDVADVVSEVSRWLSVRNQNQGLVSTRLVQTYTA